MNLGQWVRRLLRVRQPGWQYLQRGVALAQADRYDQALPLLLEGLGDTEFPDPSAVRQAMPALVRSIETDEQRAAAVQALVQLLERAYNTRRDNIAAILYALAVLAIGLLGISYHSYDWRLAIIPPVAALALFATLTNQPDGRPLAEPVLQALADLQATEALDAICHQLTRKDRQDLAWEAIGRLAVDADLETPLDEASQRAIAWRILRPTHDRQLHILEMVGGQEAIDALTRRMARGVPGTVRPLIARAIARIEARMEQDRLSAELLQPASAPQTDPGQLLRPAAGPPEVDEQQLLRPGEEE